MGTIAEELKKVMNQWDTQTVKEQTVNTNNTPTTPDKRITIKDKMMEVLRANPGVDGVKLCDLTHARHPDIPKGSVTSTVTQLAHQHYVTRKPTTINNRATFFYFPVDDATRKALVAEEERQLKLAQARAEKARAAKAAKAAEKSERVQRELPFEPMPEPTPAPEPAPVIKSTWDAKLALEGISVLQARELYLELKNIFGN